MGGDTAALPTDVDALQRLVVELQKQNSFLAGRSELLEEELRLWKHKLFGRKSERLSPEDLPQSRLFDEAEYVAEEHLKKISESAVVVEVAAHRRARRGRKPLPADLPRVEVVHDIPEDRKRCSCGAALVRIGEERCEQLEIIPQQVKVLRHIRPKYACSQCDGAENG